MIFELKQKNKVPDVTVLALFICAGVAFGFASFEGLSGRGILQLVALVIFCAMIFVAVRYKFTGIRYSLRPCAMVKRSLHREDDEDGDEEREEAFEGPNALPITSLPPSRVELVVDKCQGRGKWGSECVIRLSGVMQCVQLPEEKDKYAKLLSENKRVPKYKYFKNMAVAEQTVILAEMQSSKVLVYLETERKLTEYLRAVAVYNRGEKQ